MTRLFVAALLPDDVVARLLELPRPAEPGVRWAPPENWHVTLRFIGESTVDAVLDRLKRARLPAATAELGPTVARLNARLITLPVAGVDRLAATVSELTADLGQLEQRPFRGHVTLARTRPGARSTSVGIPFGARFEVVEIAVVVSEPGRSGSRYTVVATLPTTGPDPADTI